MRSAGCNDFNTPAWLPALPPFCLQLHLPLPPTLQGMVRGYTKLFAGDGNCFGPAAVGVEISKAVLEGVPGPEGASMQPPPECKT